MPAKYVQVQGIATLLHHRGPTTLPGSPPETSRGEVVVCLHDAGDNGGVFAGLLDVLAGRHSPLAFDQPAHGRSAGLDGLGSVERLAAFTLALVEEFALRPPVLLGQGLGAAVALEIALQRAEAVRALVLCGAAADPRVGADRLTALQRVTEGKARREFDASGYSPKTPREVYARAFSEWLKTDPRAQLADWRALDDWSAGERVANLLLPVLVATGADEDEARRADAVELVRLIPEARAVEVPEAGHRLALEQPGRFGEAVCSFLEALPA